MYLCMDSLLLREACNGIPSDCMDIMKMSKILCKAACNMLSNVNYSDSFTSIQRALTGLY